MSNKQRFKIGDEVLVIRGEWGVVNGMCAIVDVVGVIAEINPKDNIHKYCIKTDKSRIYSDNKKGNGDILFKKLNHV